MAEDNNETKNAAEDGVALSSELPPLSPYHSDDKGSTNNTSEPSASSSPPPLVAYDKICGANNDGDDEFDTVPLETPSSLDEKGSNTTNVFLASSEPPSKVAEEKICDTTDDGDDNDTTALSSKNPSPPTSSPDDNKKINTSVPTESSGSPPPSSPPKAASEEKSNNGDGDDDSTTTTTTTTRFQSIHKSIQRNIETFNFVTKEIEKLNDRILFHSKTMTVEEESTLIQKVSHLHKNTSITLRDTSRLIKNLRREAIHPTEEKEATTTTADNNASESNEKKKNEDKEKTTDDEKQKEEEKSRDKSEKEAICKMISRSFTDELLLYQSTIQDFKNELKDRLIQKVQSIRPNSSEDFIDLSLRSESSRYSLFREIMAADEKDLSEEDAKAFKDEIAEKYVVIAELSMGGKEMNQIFLNLASASHTSLSDGSSSGTGTGDDSDKTPTTRAINNKRRSFPKNPFSSFTSRSSATVDDLLGDINRAQATADQYYASNPSLFTTGATDSTGKDADEKVDGESTSQGSPQGKRRNRLFPFMKRHRNASPASASKDTSDVKTVSKRRRGRRWKTLFLLATVAVAAMYGVVFIH